MKLLQPWLGISCCVIMSVFACDSVPTKEFVLLKYGKIPSIVTDLGSYTSAEAAIAASSKINWFEQNDEKSIYLCALAAIELRDYLCEMSGLDPDQVKIVDDSSPTTNTIICVGKAPENKTFSHFSRSIRRRWKRNQDHPQGFRIDSFADQENEMLLLMGVTPTGTLYAVYDLLEHLGVRWFRPGELGRIVPHYSDIVLLPYARYEHPVIDKRGFWYDQNYSPHRVSFLDDSIATEKDFFEWLGRNRINIVFDLLGHTSQLKNRGIEVGCIIDDLFRMFLDKNSPYPYNHPSFNGDNQYPPDPYPQSDFFRGDIDKNGQLSYFEAHPEWFGAKADKKDFNNNFCVTNEYGFTELVKNLSVELKNGDYRGVEVLNINTANFGHFCQCENCKKLGDDSAKHLYFLSKIRNVLHEIHERGILSQDVEVFFDFDGIRPPNSNQIQNVDFDYKNTGLVFSMKNRCFNHSINDIDCTEGNLPLLMNLKNWTGHDSHYKGNIMIEACYNDRGYRDLPVVFMHVMSFDIPFYAYLGINGIYERYSTISNPGVRVLLNYQFTKQTWDPFLISDSLWQDFFRQYFANVAPEMKDFYNKLEGAMANSKAWQYELYDRLLKITSGELDEPLFPFTKFKEHFHIEDYNPMKNNGIDWEQTYQYMNEAGFALNDVIRSEVDDTLLDRLVEIERHYRYGLLTVLIYDSAISLLSLGKDEPEMREEALIRLKQYSKNLERFSFHSPESGYENGLQGSGLEKIVNNLLQTE